MSDLTRYSFDAAAAEMVSADEAEARIAELEAERDQWKASSETQRHAAILELDNARDFAKKRVYDKYGSQLRAANKLALIEREIRPGTVVSQECRILEGAAAYREAGK